MVYEVASNLLTVTKLTTAVWRIRGFNCKMWMKARVKHFQIVTGRKLNNAQQ